MDTHLNGWFTEKNNLWRGQAFSIEIEKIVVEKKSKVQDILIFDSKEYGRCLVLDGIIQCTEKDEFSYQEMICHLAMFSHPHPKKVLVVGGGDGGVVREVLKHSTVEEVILCEIDETVVELSKQYLPFMSSGLEDKKCHIHFGDGLKFMEQHQNQFDVIITDSSDPVGPAQSLFQSEYYKLMNTALTENGIIISQGECLWLHLKFIESVYTFCKKIFPVVSYAYTCLPTYPSGQIGFILCSKNSQTIFTQPKRKLSNDEISEMKLKYYNSNVHCSSFTLPQFASQILNK